MSGRGRAGSAGGVDLTPYDDPEDAVSVAFRLTRRRLRLSQRELAEVLGWDPSAVGRWESGHVSKALGRVDGVLRGMGFRLAVVVVDPDEWADVDEPMEHRRRPRLPSAAGPPRPPGRAAPALPLVAALPGQAEPAGAELDLRDATAGPAGEPTAAARGRRSRRWGRRRRRRRRLRHGSTELVGAPTRARGESESASDPRTARASPATTSGRSPAATTKAAVRHHDEGPQSGIHGAA